MASETVVYTPENNGGTVPAWMAMNNGGLFGGNNGWGGGILGFLLGLFFGNGWGGFGGFGGGWGGNNGAGFISNQIDNNAGRELLMNAINSNGEASRAAIQNLATMLGQDFNLVNSGVQGIRDGIANLASQTGMSSLQIINAIQAGDAAMQSQLSQCCCQMKQLVTEQGFQNQIATLNQTNTLTGAISDLKAEMISQFCASEKRDMQDKINTQGEIISQLRSQIDNANQTAQFQAMLAPIMAQVNALVAKTPQTVPVIWLNLVATPATTTTTTGA